MDSSLLVGSVLAGKYRVDRVVGEGGMGVVLAALHLDLEERVAIKLLHEEAARDAEQVARFLREGKATARIRSEHIVRVRDVARLEDGTPYMVMELLEGTDLGDLVARHRPMPVAAAVDHVLQACDALAEAHAAGVIHRDVKPSNIFLTRRRNGTPCVKVLDFGISKLSSDSNDPRRTYAKAVFGSPLYMSPEQLLSSTDVDARADVWSMAVVLYELLLGRPPFDAPSLAALHLAIVQEPAPDVRRSRPEVPEALARAIHAALAKKREERTPSIAAFAASIAPFASPVGRDALATLQATPLAPAMTASVGAAILPMPGPSAQPAQAATQGTFTSPSRPAQRRLPILAASLGLLALVGTFGIVSSLLARRTPPAGAAAPASSAPPAITSTVASSHPATSAEPPASGEPAASSTSALGEAPAASTEPPAASTEPPAASSASPAATPSTAALARPPAPRPAPRPSSTGRASLPDDRR